MDNLCVIPARGGSKRIPRKNIKEFCGQPIIAYSIQAALDSQCFSRVIVSTDDEEIAEVAKQYGAEVPFMRPEDLADDYATTMMVISHAIQMMQLQNYNPFYTCCLYATAPFVKPEDLRKSLKVLQRCRATYCLSVTDFAFPIQRAIQLSNDGGLSMFYPEFEQTRSQDLPHAYHDAGQIYWGVSEAWVQNLSVFASYSVAYQLPRYRVQDIDTMDDWFRAEWLYKVMKMQKEY